MVTTLDVSVGCAIFGRNGAGVLRLRKLDHAIAAKKGASQTSSAAQVKRAARSTTSSVKTDLRSARPLPHVHPSGCPFISQSRSGRPSSLARRTPSMKVGSQAI